MKKDALFRKRMKEDSIGFTWKDYAFIIGMTFIFTLPIWIGG